MPTSVEVDDDRKKNECVREPVVQSGPCITRNSTWAAHATGNTPSNCMPRNTASLASIMEDEKKAACQRKKFEKVKSEQAQDDDLLKIALQASLAEVSLKEETFDEEMRQALSLSVRKFHPDPAAVGVESMEEVGLSPAEQAEIEKALRVADEEATAKSLQLALELQAAEEDAARPPISHRAQGHVRLMTRSELWQEQSLQGTTHSCQLHDADYSLIEGKEQDQGYRINASTPSGLWSRANGSTIVGPNNELRTKHDITLQGQANAQRLGIDFAHSSVVDQKPASIGNKAFNSFRHSMQKKTIKGVAAHGHGRAAQDTDRTRGGAMDPKVRLQITKAINNGLLETCNGVVKEGKEALVYHGEEGKESGGFDVAVKVFKRIQEFKQRGLYVDGDPRYPRSKFSQASAREQLELWTEKEFRNLVRANKAGVPVPTPLFYKDNVLFMRFLGEDGFPSPQLRELQLKRGSRKWNTLYDQTMAAVKLLYQKGRLVHCDLSEYNIMVCPCRLVENSLLDPSDQDDNALQVVLIDFGQAVNVHHPDAKKLLQRDLTRIKEFFEKMSAIATMSIDVAEEFVTMNDDEETAVGNEDVSRKPLENEQ
mmetsp:Transcript_23614/g.34846  ORF Transcript_23614/g.34846 Transcript_23614/m.34846 type:complete len:597 (-) Transcript_23614:1527-3317(-)